MVVTDDGCDEVMVLLRRCDVPLDDESRFMVFVAVCGLWIELDRGG